MKILLLIFMIFPFIFGKKKASESHYILKPFELPSTQRLFSSNLGLFLRETVSIRPESASSYFNSSAIKGLICGAVSFAVTQFLTFIGILDPELSIVIHNLLLSFLSFFFLLFALIAYRKNNQGDLTRKQSLRIGSVFGIFSGIASQLLTYLFIQVDPYSHPTYYEVFQANFFSGLLIMSIAGLMRGIIFSLILSFFIKSR